MFATISADIVSSTTLSVDETIKLKQQLSALFALLSKTFPDFQGRQIKGDYIECIMNNAQNVFRVALILKSFVKSFHIAANKDTKLFQVYGIRTAIGIGTMRIVNTEEGIWDGEAIYRSGRSLEEMNLLNRGTLTIQTFDPNQTATLQVIASLTDALFNDMTLRQSEVIFHKLLGFKETEIAEKLGISQSGVNKASTATKWYCIEEALKYFENLQFEKHEQ